jgi:FdhE protein
MLPELSNEGESAIALPLSREQAEVKLAAGVPLLRGEPLSLDNALFLRRWRRACAALDAAGSAGTGTALTGALQEGKLHPAALLEAVLVGQPERLREQFAQADVEPGLAMTLLRYTLFPMFAAVETRVASWRSRIVWERGYCPTCGSWPLLGEFRGLDQSRFLRCGLCAAGWEAARLWCPYCGNRDHEELHFLHAEGEENRYRAAVCDACRGYVKMVSVLSALPLLHLLIADLATLHLDLAAAERRYTNQP